MTECILTSPITVSATPTLIARRNPNRRVIAIKNISVEDFIYMKKQGREPSMPTVSNYDYVLRPFEALQIETTAAFYAIATDSDLDSVVTVLETFYAEV